MQRKFTPVRRIQANKNNISHAQFPQYYNIMLDESRLGLLHFKRHYLAFSFICICFFLSRLPFQQQLHLRHTKSTHFAAFAFIACALLSFFLHLHFFIFGHFLEQLHHIRIYSQGFLSFSISSKICKWKLRCHFQMANFLCSAK